MKTKFVRVMDGIKSNAGGFEYKLDEVNYAELWRPNSSNSKDMGGFNFTTEDKVLRWLHRGDTMYDVIIPEDAEVILYDEDKGIYRTNKIIVTNPRKITDEMIIELYKINNLPSKVIYQCLVILLYINKRQISEYIINDFINEENIEESIIEYEDYVSKGNFDYTKLSEDEKYIYNILKEMYKNY